jgi:hypothetical protein
LEYHILTVAWEYNLLTVAWEYNLLKVAWEVRNVPRTVQAFSGRET